MRTKARAPVHLFLLGIAVSSVAVAEPDPGLILGVSGQSAAVSVTPTAASTGADDLSSFEDQYKEVEAALAGEESRPREDLLVMYGRSSAASGRYDLAAAAYAMFLNEFGTDHPYSARIAMRLADCLAPLNLKSVIVAHTEAGPQFQPQWRMGHESQPQRLQQALAAYELAAELASDRAGVGRALLRIGWVHRVLDDWEASTRAWDRCVAEAGGTHWSADALWLAAENLTWTGQPAAAAERLRQLTADYPEDSRRVAATERAECLEAESRRGAEWLVDPATSLQAEIKERAAVRSAHEVYRSVLEWLRCEKHLSAQIATARWACTQTDWPLERRIACHHDLVTALLDLPAAGEAERQEAAEVLGRIVDLAPRDDWAIPAALRRSRLLSELGRLDLADRTLDGIADRAGDSRYEPYVLAERIRVLLDRGNVEQAAAVFETLSEAYPEHNLTEEFAAMFSGACDEGGQK